MFSKIKNSVFAFVLLLVMNTSLVMGQNSGFIVTSKVDTNLIRIGEQFHLELNAVVKPKSEIIFPFLPDTFNGFEIVQRSQIDTIPNSNPPTLRQQFTVTAFDSGYFVMPPMPFLVRELKNKISDTVATEAILIGVKTVPVDTTKAIKDIKSIMSVPYPWLERLPMLIGGLIVVGGLIFWAYYLSQKKKKKITAPPKPKSPAHVRAMEALKKIEAEKLWQNGLIKKYHIEVSDTLRAYIEERFDIRAMEQTSDETLALIHNMLSSELTREKLRYTLQLADMVKFAKVEPVAPENEKVIANAYEFITSTAPAITEAEEIPTKKEVRS